METGVFFLRFAMGAEGEKEFILYFVFFPMQRVWGYLRPYASRHWFSGAREEWAEAETDQSIQEDIVRQYHQDITTVWHCCCYVRRDWTRYGLSVVFFPLCIPFLLCACHIFMAFYIKLDKNYLKGFRNSVVYSSINLTYFSSVSFISIIPFRVYFKD